MLKKYVDIDDTHNQKQKKSIFIHEWKPLKVLGNSEHKKLLTMFWGDKLIQISFSFQNSTTVMKYGTNIIWYNNVLLFCGLHKYLYISYMNDLVCYNSKRNYKIKLWNTNIYLLIIIHVTCILDIAKLSNKPIYNILLSNCCFLKIIRFLPFTFYTNKITVTDQR